MEISAINATSVNVVVGRNVKNMFKNKNIGIVSKSEPVINFPIDTGKSAAIFQVWPFIVAYATLSFFLYDKNHTGNIAQSVSSM